MVGYRFVLDDFLVSIGHYQKIGRLYKVDSADVHGACDFSLIPDNDGMIEVVLVEASSEPEGSLDFDVQELVDLPDLTEEQLVSWLHCYISGNKFFQSMRRIMVEWML